MKIEAKSRLFAAGGKATQDQITTAKELAKNITSQLDKASSMESDDMETVIKNLRAAYNWLKD